MPIRNLEKEFEQTLGDFPEEGTLTPTHRGRKHNIVPIPEPEDAENVPVAEKLDDEEGETPPHHENHETELGDGSKEGV